MVNINMTETYLYSTILLFFLHLFIVFLVILATFGVNVHPEFKSVCL